MLTQTRDRLQKREEDWKVQAGAKGEDGSNDDG